MPVENHFQPLPVGSVRPLGWLRATLKRQAGGLTGLLDEVPPRHGFGVNPVTQNSVWLGGNAGKDFLAVRSERAPYYVRGLVALAYVLGDQFLIEKAGKWLDYWFEQQEKSGSLKAKGVSDFEWWPRMLILDAMRFYYEATGDYQAVYFMQRFFHFQRKNLKKHPLTRNIRYYPEWRSWASFRGGDNLDSIAWLYSITEEYSLIELGRTVNEQTFPWEDLFLNNYSINTHAVNLAHGVRKPAVQHMFWPDEDLKTAVRYGLRNTMRLHGQPCGSFSGDEVTHGRGSTRGTELCTVVELMRTYETLLSVFGSPDYGDALERLAFNALPAAVAPDFRSHQYFSQPNQMYCTIGKHGFHANKTDLPSPFGWYRDALAFGAPAGYECCFYNFHMGWPLFVANMWMKYHNDGLAAVVYGPCEVETRIKGVNMRIVEDTAYPFDDTIIFTVYCDNPVHFALLLRIPEWCTSGTATVGKNVYTGNRGSYLALRRDWRNGEKVVLKLPATSEAVSIDGGALSVQRGALVFAYNPEERWVSAGNSRDFPTYEVVPADEIPVKEKGKWHFREEPVWNYGLEKETSLKVNKDNTDKVNACHTDEEFFPWTPGNAPVEIKAEARRIRNWTRSDGSKTGLNAGPLPQNPLVSSKNNSCEITLIPYGCARLRISMFPEL